MSLSKGKTSLVDSATPFELVDYGPQRQVSSGPPEPLQLPDFSQARAEKPLATMDRGGFIPLMVGSRAEDPRAAAEREAEKMLASATGQADSIRSQAQNSGYEAGYEQGRQEGRAASQATVTAALDNLARISKALERARANILANMEEELVALVAAATDLVLAAPGAVESTVIRQVVSQAVSRLASAGRLTVRLHPADLEVIADFKPQLMDSFSEMEHLELTADPSLERGGCLVDSDIAQIDATLASRRDQLLAILDRALHQDQSLDLAPLADQAPPAEAAASEPDPFTAADDGAGDDLEEDW